MTEDFAAQFMGLPTYFVTNAVSEAFGQNVRIYHWEKRGSILAPQFIAVLPAADLVLITRTVQDSAVKSLDCWRGLKNHMAH